MSQPFLTAPTMRAGVPVNFRHETAIERHKTGGETRTSHAAQMLREYSFPYLLKGAEVQEAREFFESLDGETIRVPEWTSPAKVDSFSNGEFQLSCHEGIDFRCNSVYLIRLGSLEGTEYPLSSYDAASGEMVVTGSVDLLGKSDWQVYPVRVGYTSSIPNLPARTDEETSFDLKLKETVESINPAISWPTVKTFPSFRGAPVFDLFWKAGEEQWETNFSYERKGFGVSSAYVREKEIKRRFTLSVYEGDRAEVYGLIKFFDDRRGRGKGFWLSSDRCNYRLAADVASGAQVIVIEGELSRLTTERVGYKHLNLRCGLENHFVEVTNITEISGESHVTLSAPLSQALTKEKTAVSLMNFVRFASDELKMRFEADTRARTKLGFIELLEEYETAKDAGTPAYLYELSGYYSGFLTSHGEDVISMGETFTRANVTHGAISERAGVLASSATVTLIPGSTHPLMVFQRGYPVEPQEVVIYEIDLGNPDVRTTLHRGKVSGMTYPGKGVVNLNLGSPSLVAESEIPTSFIEPRCSHQFLKPGCNLVASNFEVTGTITAVGEREVSADIVATESTARGFGDWFLNGQVMVGSERRAIIKQSGSMVTVSTPFVNAKVGDEVKLLPGCVRTRGYCANRYNNFRNFGGAPFTPPTNPQLEAVRVNAKIPQGGKK